MGAKATPEQVALFVEHLLALARSDLPVPEGLRRAAAEGGGGAFRRMAQETALRLEQGLPLADALSGASEAVPPLVAAVAAAGERAGNLVRPLERLERYYHAAAGLDARLRTAVLYPAVAIGMALLLLPVYSFALGHFRALYTGMNVMPARATQFALAVGPYFSALLVALFAAGVVLLGGSSNWRASVLDRLPGVGRMRALARTARTSRLLSTLLASQVPLTEALELTAQACGEPRADAALRWLAKNVANGGSMAEALAAPASPATRVFPLTFVWTVGTGERSGELERMLDGMAGYYDEQVDALTRTIPFGLEAGILGFVGVLVLVLVVSIFVPMVSVLAHVL